VEAVGRRREAAGGGDFEEGTDVIDSHDRRGRYYRGRRYQASKTFAFQLAAKEAQKNVKPRDHDAAPLPR
jgi:hypothetical protein